MEALSCMQESESRKHNQPVASPADQSTRANRPSRRRRRRRSKGSGSDSPRQPVVEIGFDEAVEQIEPFELFGAYYLGLTANNRYRLSNSRDVARRFFTSCTVLDALLGRYGMELDTVDASSFDLGLARLDMERVPEGISRREIARQLYQEYCDLQGLTPGDKA